MGYIMTTLIRVFIANMLMRCCVSDDIVATHRHVPNKSQTYYSVNRHEGDKWDYEEIGPDKWHIDYPHCGTGDSDERQSPIDVRVTPHNRSPLIPDLQWTYNPSNTLANFFNNGHSLEIDFPNPAIYHQMSGGPLGSDTYSLKQSHFHWGGDSSKGSEHYLNGHQYPLETHFVYFNNKYADVGTAKSKPDGLAVVSILFDVGPSDNPFLELILEQVDHDLPVNKYDNISTIWDPSFFIPESAHQDWASYHGSLTTPPCYESVKWIVFTHTGTVSEKQLNILRAHGEPKNNFRPLQPLNGRLINYKRLCDPDTEVRRFGLCFYLDGSGGHCLPGYILASENMLNSTADNFVGKSYKTHRSNNCCIAHFTQTTKKQNWGFDLHAGCNDPSPFVAGPSFGGGGCSGTLNTRLNQLTLCQTPCVSHDQCDSDEYCWGESGFGRCEPSHLLQG